MGNLLSLSSSKLGSRLGFGEVIISNGKCYNELKKLNNNIDPIGLYKEKTPVRTTEINNNIKFAKFRYDAGKYVSTDPKKNIFDEILGSDRKNLIIWLGPLTRIRFYENDKFTDKNFIYENKEIDKIKIVDCTEFIKDNPTNFNSLYVSLLGDGDLEKEGFGNLTKYMKIDNFILIISISFIILLFYISYRVNKLLKEIVINNNYKL